jgi:ABC-type uncharacterized transport system fused permease/ATPase subunit|eukprot:COSAG01_NODE_24150_length_788_cov_12.641509_1_plen_107_part_00
MQEIEDELAASATGDDGRVIATTEEALVQFEDVDIVTPRGENMACGLSLRVTPHTPLMVTGASASGKSALVRVLGGLWPLPRGRLTRPIAATDLEGRPDLSGIFLV